MLIQILLNFHATTFGSGCDAIFCNRRHQTFGLFTYELGKEKLPIARTFVIFTTPNFIDYSGHEFRHAWLNLSKIQYNEGIVPQ